MKCLACEWKRRNVAHVAFCPICGDDTSLTHYADTKPVDNFPQPVDKPVDNFFAI
jgi:hypothetical protein